MADSQSKFYGLLALIFVAGAALIGYLTVENRSPTPGGDASDSLSQVVLDDLAAGDLGVVSGSASAPVVIEEYADYLCGACGMVATLTVPQILENYIDTGKARFVFYDFPLNPGSPAELAAQAARCAGDQNAFWPMHKVLMGRQREWGTSRRVTEMFRRYGDGLGLNGKAIEECVDGGKYRDAVIGSGQRARQLGLNQTPTFIINGRVHLGAMGYDRLAQIIDEELARRQTAGQAPAPTEGQ
ncbi:MAG: DsbA family protein [Gemmatimonadota bacterium]|nr:MAG: DsbA family protein [Gemmatimonadota bacterium]